MGYLLNLQGARVEPSDPPNGIVEPEAVDTSTWSYFFCRDFSHYSVWTGCGGAE